VPRARAIKPPVIAAEAGPGRATRIRQRQRLIDACISALHIHGPSRTTVEKVVAIAALSPGIVRFYFDSKAAMLVASLAYLAAEFEQRVLLPVSQLRHTPVQALELLVDLYLDPQIASPRKVSVWYSFWGEASSRQEYYDLCGKKDEDFAVLVRELIEQLIVSTGASHLDADAIALGLIGVLEIQWQSFAFQSEASIDRAASRRRSLAYLRSVFPGQFGAASAPMTATTPYERDTGDGGVASKNLAPASSARLPAWAYAHAALLAAERDRLLRPAWQFIGHDAEVPAAGDFLSVDLAGERALVVRDERGRLRAFRNACRRRPHALVIARSGHLEGAIHCASHALTYRLDGRLVDGDTPGDLSSLELKQLGPLILVRAAGAAALRLMALSAEMPSEAVPDQATEPDLSAFARMRPVGMQQIEVAADWKLIVERWLEAAVSHRQFVAPNQLIELRRDAALILQVIPVAPGRCRIQRFDYLASSARRGGSAKSRATQRGNALIGWQRQVNAWLQQEIALAESTQTGLAAAADEFEDSAPTAGPLAQFRQSVTALLPAIPTLPERPL